LKRRRRRQNGKLRRLINEIRKNTIPENDQNLLLHLPEHIEDFSINESSQQFSADELKLLNKGLKLMPKPKEPPILEIVAEIETSVKYLPISDKEDIRYECSKVIKNGNIARPTASKKETIILKTLKEGFIYKR
jgi:hypothetical protein